MGRDSDQTVENAFSFLDSWLSSGGGKKNQGAFGEFFKVVYFITGHQFFGGQVIYCFPIFIFEGGDLIGGSTVIQLVKSPELIDMYEIPSGPRVWLLAAKNLLK